MVVSIAMTIEVRLARPSDVDALLAMVDDFVADHPARHHPRSAAAVREAYFGQHPAAEIVVAERDGAVVGMVQWSRYFDMFWGFLGGRVDWLYVEPRSRGLGVPAALLARVCARVREAGGGFITGSGNERTNPLYARTASLGVQSTDVHLSAEAFQQVADLAGLPPREVVRRLPDPALNRVPAVPRGDTAAGGTA